MLSALLQRFATDLWLLDSRREAALDQLVVSSLQGAVTRTAEDPVDTVLGVMTALGIRARSVVACPGGAETAKAQTLYTVVGSVAVIHVWGVLDKSDEDVSFYGYRFGTSYESIVRGVGQAKADDRVASILLNIDSPGGAARPIEPFSQLLFAAAEEGRKGGKPVWALANDLEASAALYLGVQADKNFATPGSWVGSLGARLMTVDYSAFLNREGITVNTIKSGEFKDLGNPYRPMTDRDRAKLQAEINTYFAQFKAAVVRGRRISAEQVASIATGEGFVGEQAMAAGLVDGIRPTLSALIAEMNQSFSAGPAGLRRGTVAAAVPSPTTAGALPDAGNPRSTSMSVRNTANGSDGAPAAGETTTQAPAAPATQPVAPAAPAAGADLAAETATRVLTAERTRVSAIMAACAAAISIKGVTDLQTKAIVDPSMTAESVRTQVAQLVQAAKPPTGDITVGTDGRTRETSALELAMLAKASPDIVAKLSRNDDAARRLAAEMGLGEPTAFIKSLGEARKAGLVGLPMRYIMERCLVLAGNTPNAFADPQKLFAASYGMGPFAAAAGHGSSDFPLLLENVAQKILLVPFAEQEFIWDKISAIGSAPDFKKQSMYRMSEAGNMELIPEGKTPDEQTVGERREQVGMDTFGARFSYTFQMMMNDDLGAFARIPALFGASCARVPEDKVITIITANNVLSDGQALYSAAHNNLVGPTALSEAALQVAIDAMQNQKGMHKDKPFIYLNPKYLVVPTNLFWLAQQLYKSQVKIGGTNGEPNTVAGLVQPLKSPALKVNSATAWYLFCDPALYRAIVVNFLNGQRTPVMSRITDGSILKMTWEFVFWCGATAVDPEATTKNAGA